MSTNVVPTKATSVARVDMKVEVVVIPVSDVERAKEFYQRLGWRVDVTPPGSGIVQLTPHGSSCSVQFGREPHAGRARFSQIVSDRFRYRRCPEQARRRRHRGERDLPHRSGRPRQRSGSRARQLLFARHVQRSRRQRLAAARGHHPASGARRFGRNFVRLRKRPGECASACGGCPRQARKAHRRDRSELARLVRRVHGGGTGRDGTANVSDYDAIVIGGRQLVDG